MQDEGGGCFRIVAAVALCASVLSTTEVQDVSAAERCTKVGAHAARMDDRRTTEEVERRIARDENVAALADRVTVSTEEGVVTLRGTVPSGEDRLVLASLAESAPGVRRVEDQLVEDQREGQPWHAPHSASPAR